MADEPSSGASFVIAPDARDWTAANYLYIRHRWLWGRLIAAFLILWAAYAVLMIVLNGLDYGWNAYWALFHVERAFFFALAVSAVLIVFVLAMVPRRVRKQLRDVERLSRETRVEFDESGLRTRNSVGGLTLGWHQMKRWLENSRVIVLMITDREMLVIPKAQVDDSTAAALRTHLVDSGLPEGGERA